MHIKRIDFVTDDNQEMALLYNANVLKENEAKEIIKNPVVQMNGFSNSIFKKDIPCFFLSTSQADMLSCWINQIVEEKILNQSKTAESHNLDKEYE